MNPIWACLRRMNRVGDNAGMYKSNEWNFPCLTPLAGQNGDMRHYSTLTRKGQTTVPKEVRELLRLSPRQKIAFVVEEGKVTLEPATTSIKDLLASIGSPAAKTKRGLSMRQIRKIYQAKRLKAWREKHG